MGGKKDRRILGEAAIGFRLLDFRVLLFRFVRVFGHSSGMFGDSGYIRVIVG